MQQDKCKSNFSPSVSSFSIPLQFDEPAIPEGMKSAPDDRMPGARSIWQGLQSLLLLCPDLFYFRPVGIKDLSAGFPVCPDTYVVGLFPFQIADYFHGIFISFHVPFHAIAIQ